MTRIALLGATGSIGQQTVDVVRAHQDDLELVCLAAERNIDGLEKLLGEFPDSLIAVSDAEAGRSLRARMSGMKSVFDGPDAMFEALEATKPDIAVIAVSGMTGLPLLERCLKQGTTVALANKEAIVSGGDVISDLRRNVSTRVIPLDSEHAALYQCLGDSLDAAEVTRLWITASGGPFREWTVDRMRSASAADALAHPTWNMGPKITVDCATMANKGLEVIEAHYLFSMPADRIKVVIQPQSLVHSMVEFNDSSVLAQIAPPDMRIPIRRALLGGAFRDSIGPAPLDFWDIGSILFERPDTKRFPCLELAYEALRANLTAVFNAADEAAVQSFIDGQIPFLAIPRLIEAALKEFSCCDLRDVPEILGLDREVHRYTTKRIERKEY